MNTITGAPVDAIDTAAVAADVAPILIADASVALDKTWSSSKINETVFTPTAFDSDLIPDTDNTRDLGQPSKKLKTAHVQDLIVYSSATGIDHTELDSIGTNTHAQIDTNLTTLNTKTQYMTAGGGTTVFSGSVNTPSGSGTVTAFNFLGVDQSSGIFTFWKDPTNANVRRMGLGSNGLELFNISRVYPTVGNTNLGDPAKPFADTYAANYNVTGTNTYTLQGSGSDLQLNRSGVGNILFYNATNANVTTPIIRGLYIGPGARPTVTSGFTMTQNGAPIVNSTTKTALLGTGLGSLSTSANVMITGSASRLAAGGQFSTFNNNQLITLRLENTTGAGTILHSIPVNIQTAAPADSSWVLEAFYNVRGTGVAAPIVVNLRATFASTVATSIVTTTIDTTSVFTLSLTGQWATANANNIVQCLHATATNYFQPQS